MRDDRCWFETYREGWKLGYWRSRGNHSLQVHFILWFGWTMRPRWTRGQGQSVGALGEDRHKQQKRVTLGEIFSMVQFNSGVKYIPTQLAERGDFVFFFGLIVVGALPLFAASVFAKRSFARRCCGVCAWHGLIIMASKIATFSTYHDGLYRGKNWGRQMDGEGMIRDVNMPAKKRPRCFLRRHVTVTLYIQLWRGRPPLKLNDFNPEASCVLGSIVHGLFNSMDSILYLLSLSWYPFQKKKH